MKRKEQGVALVIGLLLLAVATIVGVAGLSGSNMQERIAANQRQQTEVFMAAETGFAKAVEWFNQTDEEDGIRNHAKYWFNFRESEIIGYIEADGVSTGNGFSWDIESIVFDGNKATITSLGLFNGDQLRRVRAVVEKQPATGPYTPGSQSAYTCHGLNCRVRVHGTVTVDGHDFQLPSSDLGDLDDKCTGGNCDSVHATPPSHQVGIYLAGNSNSSGNDIVSCGSANINGDPDPTMAESSYTGSYDVPYWSSYVSALESSDAYIIDINQDISDVDYGNREDQAILRITGNVSITGNVNIKGVIIVDSGASLDFGGNGAFEGLILVKPTGQFTFSAGTKYLYGSVINMNGDSSPYTSGNVCSGSSEAGTFDLDTSGTLYIRYSAEALGNVGNVNSGTDPLDVVEWTEVIPNS